jgi:hypothetical protein
MNTEWGKVICFFILLGWIPILAIGKAISMVVKTACSYKYPSNNKEEYYKEEENEE